MSISPKEVFDMPFKEFIFFIKYQNEAAAAESAVIEEQKRKAKLKGNE